MSVTLKLAIAVQHARGDLEVHVILASVLAHVAV
jgi:hypothetical protein